MQIALPPVIVAGLLSGLSSTAATTLPDSKSIISPVTDRTAAVGSDVVALMRRVLNGDLAGRPELNALAASGRSDAQEALGELLGPSGPTTLRDEVAACGWFQKAASGRADSLHNLALCAEKGVVGAPDPARAAVLYRQAAERGHAKSLCALGNLYMAGKGVPKDEAKGAALCRRAANRGEQDAQTDLGNMYLKGVGVPHDMVEARHWYELAAAQGQHNAEFTLGQIYWNGDGVARNQTKAAELWKKSYNGGRIDAAPLLAAWLFASWMSAHPRGDTTGLDEAIRYQAIAVSTSSESKRAEAEGLLTMMRTARGLPERAK